MRCEKSQWLRESEKRRIRGSLDLRDLRQLTRRSVMNGQICVDTCSILSLDYMMA